MCNLYDKKNMFCTNNKFEAGIELWISTTKSTQRNFFLTAISLPNGQLQAIIEETHWMLIIELFVSFQFDGHREPCTN